MSVTHTSADAPTTAVTAHDHPGDLLYIKVAIILALMTSLEVSTYYIDFGWAFLPVLIVLMVVKFIIVVLFFMHLRFDSRIFGRLFWSGLLLAVTVYAAALTTFQFWDAGI